MREIQFFTRTFASSKSRHSLMPEAVRFFLEISALSRNTPYE